MWTAGFGPSFSFEKPLGSANQSAAHRFVGPSFLWPRPNDSSELHPLRFIGGATVPSPSTAPRSQRGRRSRMSAAAASQVGAEKGDYLGLVQLIGRPAAARPAPPLRPCTGDSDDYFSRILLVGILTGVPTSGSSLYHHRGPFCVLAGFCLHSFGQVVCI